MKISRKNFIKSASLITGSFIFGMDKAFSRTLSFSKSGFKNLRDNIGIYFEKGGTIGWYISNDASVVIDSQFADTAEHFFNGFRERTSRNIDFLFNTHHHRDHTSGNIFLKKYSDNIVAHENCPRLQEKANKGTDNEKMQVYADITFKNQWQREIGKETVHAGYFGAAHTGGDSVIYFEKANIAHMGDLVFNEIVPVIDLPGGGSINGWIKVLEAAADLYPKDTIYIFGHGANEELLTGKQDILFKMRDYLSALLDFVSKEIGSDKNIDEIKMIKTLPGYEKMTESMPERFASNLQSAFNELKGLK